MRIRLLAVFVLWGLWAGQPPAAQAAGDLAPPFAVTVDGVLIDRTPDAASDIRDNSHPWLGDFDGDGKLDLLIGQAGRLRIYLDLGGKEGPRFAEPIWFDDQVPTGRIPRG